MRVNTRLVPRLSIEWPSKLNMFVRATLGIMGLVRARASPVNSGTGFAQSQPLVTSKFNGPFENMFHIKINFGPCGIFTQIAALAGSRTGFGQACLKCPGKSCMEPITGFWPGTHQDLSRPCDAPWSPVQIPHGAQAGKGNHCGSSISPIFRKI